jgi:hypothetical protein
VTEKGKEEYGRQPVDVQLLPQGLVKNLMEVEVRLQQRVAGLPLDAVVEQHWYPPALVPPFASLLSLMCALLHFPTGDKAADRLQAQKSSAVKIRKSTARHNKQISYLSRHSIQKPTDGVGIKKNENTLFSFTSYQIHCVFAF